jgi:hypothetical protein
LEATMPDGLANSARIPAAEAALFVLFFAFFF